MTYHVLGAGSLGCLIASRLRSSGFKVTLIFKSFEANDFFRKNPNIVIHRSDENVAFSGFESEYVKQPGDLIKYLFITTKAQQTLPALRSLKHRISSDTTFIILQNGLGVVDEFLEDTLFNLNTSIKPCPLKIILGVVTHGVHRKPSNPYHIMHASSGQIWLGLANELIHPHISSHTDKDDLEDLWNAMAGLQLNISTRVPPTTMVELLLRKFTANICINPLTALAGYCNGQLLEDKIGLKMVSKICQEADLVYPKIFPTVAKDRCFYDPLELTKMVNEVCKTTKLNRSSMLQDLERGNKTEIDYLNGYLVRKAKLSGIPTPVNELFEMLIREEEKS